MVLRVQWPLGTIAQFFHFVAEEKKKDDKKTKAFYDWATTGIPVKSAQFYSDFWPTCSLLLSGGYLRSMFWRWYKWWFEFTLGRNNRQESIVLQMHDLRPKVVEETKTHNPLELCSWQRWEITEANHNFECDYKSSFTHIFIKRRIPR